MTSIYERIIALFNENHVKYTEAEHHQEGHGTHVAEFHGLDETCGAKAIVVKLKKPDSYCLVVLPFTRNLDSKALQKIMGVKGASFAPHEISEELTGCVSGSIPPFSFHDDVLLIIDNAIKDHQKIFFNAGRLDRSVTINTSDYCKLVNSAKFADISKTK